MCRLRARLQDAAQRGGDFAGRQHAQRHLIEQGLKGVMVLAVDQGDGHRLIRQAFGRIEPSEPPADDDDPRNLHTTYRHVPSSIHEPDPGIRFRLNTPP